MENDIAGLRAPHPDLRGIGICGALPHTPTEGNIYAGFYPAPHSRTFLPKSPRDPKKPDWVRFNLSNKDSKQGCRMAALLLV